MTNFEKSLRAKMNEFNRKYFKSRLNLKGLRIEKIEHNSYAMAITRVGIGFKLVYNSIIPNCPILDDIIVHEMIHIYQLQVLGMTWEDILTEDEYGHGKSFRAKADQLKLTYGVDTYSNTMYSKLKDYMDNYKAA